MSASNRRAEWLYAAGWNAVKRMPPPLASRAFQLGADIATMRAGTGVRQLAKNLRRVLGPEATDEELSEATKAAMRSYARYWQEVFRLPVMDTAEVARTVDRYAEGTEHLDKAMAQGNGAIIVLVHSGNWDANGIWLVERGLPFTTVVERQKPESLFDRFVAYRESLGMEILPLSGGSRAPTQVLTERLREGRLVCLLGDRDLSASGVEVSFFGEKTTMPPGPAYLAIRTGAALLPAALWFTPDGWGHRIHPPVEIPLNGSLPERLSVTTQRVANVFASDLVEHAVDWHMVQPLWAADLTKRTDTGQVTGE